MPTNETNITTPRLIEILRNTSEYLHKDLYFMLNIAADELQAYYEAADLDMIAAIQAMKPLEHQRKVLELREQALSVETSQKAEIQALQDRLAKSERTLKDYIRKNSNLKKQVAELTTPMSGDTINRRAWVRSALEKKTHAGADN